MSVRLDQRRQIEECRLQGTIGRAVPWLRHDNAFQAQRPGAFDVGLSIVEEDVAMTEPFEIVPFCNTGFSDLRPSTPGRHECKRSNPLTEVLDHPRGGQMRE